MEERLVLEGLRDVASGDGNETRLIAEESCDELKAPPGTSAPLVHCSWLGQIHSGRHFCWVFTFEENSGKKSRIDLTNIEGYTSNVYSSAYGYTFFSHNVMSMHLALSSCEQECQNSIIFGCFVRMKYENTRQFCIC